MHAYTATPQISKPNASPILKTLEVALATQPLVGFTNYRRHYPNWINAVGDSQLVGNGE